MKKKNAILMLVLLTCCIWPGKALTMPVTLSTEYNVNARVANVDVNSWAFTYQVTNLNQGIPGNPYGLDVFAIQIPNSATVTSYTVPPPYVRGSNGFWSAYQTTDSGEFFSLGKLKSDPGYYWMVWCGIFTASVYTPGTKANFSITLNNVSVDTNEGGLVTYWGLHTPKTEYYTTASGNYTPYITNLLSPASVPLPSSVPLPGSIVLLGSGISGLFAIRRNWGQSHNVSHYDSE